MRKPGETRRRIVEAADALFYGEGVRSVSVDRIAETAGVTKRTLYYHFRSKDELIAAYLEARDDPTAGRYRVLFERFHGTLSQRIGAMFAEVGKLAGDPKWKGCAFVRTAAELAGLPGHPAIVAASKHKRDFAAWLADLLQAENLADNAFLARQLVILLDGAISEILVHRAPVYAAAAGAAAVALIEAAIKSRQEEARRDRDITIVLPARRPPVSAQP